MKIVIAPDSFKGTLTARQVADAIGQGISRVLPDARIDLCPMADGGEGTVAVVVAATGGEIRRATVTGPLGEPVDAEFGLFGDADGRVAVIEMAAASGLPLVPADRRNPSRTTSYGTGQLILAALDAGAREIILGIGGSATVDGGAGCLQAMGIRFVDPGGADLATPLTGGVLRRITEVHVHGLDVRLRNTAILIACDVTNPLLGPDGAARAYGPQKGADPEEVTALEDGLANLARILAAEGLCGVPGAGAAGGLGFGLSACAGARLTPGLPLVAEVVLLRERLVGADLCVTGEGRLDAQSERGKTAVGVAAIARELGVPVVCIPGQAAPDAPVGLFDDVHPLVGAGVGLADALDHPVPWLRRRAAEVAARHAGIV